MKLDELLDELDRARQQMGGDVSVYLMAQEQWRPLERARVVCYGGGEVILELAVRE